MFMPEVRHTKKLRYPSRGSEKKIWYIVLFQKKYVENVTTTSKMRKENLFFMPLYEKIDIYYLLTKPSHEV
jgi:hypothetical protein